MFLFIYDIGRFKIAYNVLERVHKKCPNLQKIVYHAFTEKI